MDIVSKIVCTICNNTPDIVVESSCCGDIYCWKCVKDVKFSCGNCHKELRSNCFVVNQPVQQLIDKSKTPSISTLQCPLNCGISLAGMTSLQEHFQYYCPNWFDTCTGCGLSLKRIEMSSHSQMCQATRLVECEYAKYGCKSKISPDKMGEHIREYARSHLALLTTAVKSFEDDPQTSVSTPMARRSLPTPLTAPIALDSPVLTRRQTNSPMNMTTLPSTPPAQIQAAQPSPSISATILQLENYVKSLLNTASSYLSANSGTYHPMIASTTNYIANFLGNDGLPLIAKLGILLLLVLILKGPLFFIIRLLILAFTCFTSYHFVSSTSMYNNGNTRPYVIGGYSLYALYIISAFL